MSSAESLCCLDRSGSHSAFLTCFCPAKQQFLSCEDALSQIEIDEGLIGNIILQRLFLKELYRVVIKPDRDLLLELLCVRIVQRFAKIVFLSHPITFLRIDLVHALTPYGLK